jgi:ribosomal protein S27E
MILDLSSGLTESVLAKIRKHAAGTENLSTRKLGCHYCEHNTIVVFADSQGHIQAKCKKCGREAIYNVRLGINYAILLTNLRN